MEGSMMMSLDKLPIRRLTAIEENGVEHFPPREVSADEKLLSLLHGIDFTPLVLEREAKKPKTSKESQPAAATQWPWQGLVESLQQVHQEISVVIDLINHVEANEAVAVAGMTKPKPLPNELLSDLSVSLSTKLQCFRQLGKYFKQSAKALEQQVAREARFYGALSRLQQNWKVKRQRALASTAGSEGFMIDLSDNPLSDPSLSLRPSPASMVRIDHGPLGMLTVHVPPKSCHAIQLGFLGGSETDKQSQLSTKKSGFSVEASLEGKEEVISDEDVNAGVKETHSLLRDIHLAIFDELVFESVSREALYQKPGVYVAGMRENFVLLSIGQQASVFLRLLPSNEDATGKDSLPTREAGTVPGQTTEGAIITTKKHDDLKKDRLPNPLALEIYLQQLVYETTLRVKERQSSGRLQGSIQPIGGGDGILSHFCMTLAHRIFSYKVLSRLENLVAKVPYLRLVSDATWHSRTSSWSVYVDVPQSILSLHLNRQAKPSGVDVMQQKVMSRFHNKVVVNEECITIGGESTSNVVGLFVGDSVEINSTINRYECDLANLSLVLLQQVASQIVHWLFEEALIVGMKPTRDLLSISFELEKGEKLSLVAHLDPEDEYQCLTWWLLVEDSVVEEVQMPTDLLFSGGSENKRFLGHLSLEELYAVLMDLVGLCGSS
ncbi:mediator of RNA polymerase II transcription subunit 17 [Nymphaea colorata]|nr:mediator of RNA polymerase II transcription subunit 17 [Nymphaea colorata]